MMDSWLCSALQVVLEQQSGNHYTHADAHRAIGVANMDAMVHFYLANIIGPW